VRCQSLNRSAALLQPPDTMHRAQEPANGVLLPGSPNLASLIGQGAGMDGYRGLAVPCNAAGRWHPRLLEIGNGLGDLVGPVGREILQCRIPACSWPVRSN